MDEVLLQAFQQLLADRCPPAMVRAIESGAPPSDLWRAIEDSGFADVLLPEDDGGGAVSLADAFALLELCGRHALPVPLAQTLLVRAVLAGAGAARPAGSIAIADEVHVADDAVLCGHVPYGAVCDWVFAAWDGRSVLLPASQATRTPGVSALDASLRWRVADAARALTLAGACDTQALLACSLAAQISGALMQVFDSTLAYANTREQFGRPIGKFQAIQHQLSVLSEHTFAARMAAQIGCQSPAAAPDRVRVAIAKARTSEAALEVATLAHSIHGAIGFTAEFDLQLFTRRLHQWRQAGGSESLWHGVLGEALVDGPAGLTLDLIRAATAIHSEPSMETP